MDNTTYQILKLFYNNTFEQKTPLSCENIEGLTYNDIELVKQSCLFLRQHRYIYTTDITQKDNDVIHVDSPYYITVEGKAYVEIKSLENGNQHKDFLVQFGNFIIALVALILSIVK